MKSLAETVRLLAAPCLAEPKGMLRVDGAYSEAIHWLTFAGRTHDGCGMTANQSAPRNTLVIQRSEATKDDNAVGHWMTRQNDGGTGRNGAFRIKACRPYE